MANYLCSLKVFPNDNEKDSVRFHLSIIPKVDLMKNEETEKDYNLVSNIICCFVDYMKLLAPEVDLEENILKVLF